MKLPSFKQRSRRTEAWDLDAPLLKLSRHDALTGRQACGGILGIGGTGSGKTTLFGNLAVESLKQGWGAIVFTVKPDERRRWVSYAEEAGRLDDVLIFGADEKLRFNFLDELNRGGRGAGLVLNAVSALESVVEIMDRGLSGRGDEPFWALSRRELMTNAVDLVAMSKGRLCVRDLNQVVSTAPGSLHEMCSEAWKATPCCTHLMDADRKSLERGGQEDFEPTADYFMRLVPKMPEKTRGSVMAMYSALMSVLSRGLVRELMCTTTNVTPADVEAGKILIIDLPILEYREVGLCIQAIWKWAFQQHVQWRSVTKSPRPVVMWCDEAQYLVNAHDVRFQTVCREARVATVMLTQTISNFYAALGGTEQSRAEADSLLACLTTKFFCASGDPVTTEWAARVVGRTRQLFANGSSSVPQPNAVTLGFPELAPPGQSSAGYSESYEYELQPSAFGALRTGGPMNGWKVDAIVHQSGRVFRESNRSWLPVTLRQRL